MKVGGKYEVCKDFFYAKYNLVIFGLNKTIFFYFNN